MAQRLSKGTPASLLALYLFVGPYSGYAGTCLLFAAISQDAALLEALVHPLLVLYAYLLGTVPSLIAGGLTVRLVSRQELRGWRALLAATLIGAAVPFVIMLGVRLAGGSVDHQLEALFVAAGVFGGFACGIVVARETQRERAWADHPAGDR